MRLDVLLFAGSFGLASAAALAADSLGAPPGDAERTRVWFALLTPVG